jgi:hypothetical protein
MYRHNNTILPPFPEFAGLGDHISIDANSIEGATLTTGSKKVNFYKPVLKDPSMKSRFS